jgi:hypothetical protein
MDIVWPIHDGPGVICSVRRIWASLYLFRGVELLASEDCWTWRVCGSWQARLRGLEESRGPERAGSRLKQNGTTEFSKSINKFACRWDKRPRIHTGICYLSICQCWWLVSVNSLCDVNPIDYSI